MTAAHRPIGSADDLRHRIRELAATEPNPGRVTDQLLQALTPAEYRVVVFASLHRFVYDAMRTPTQDTPMQQTYETASGGRTASRKVAGIRDWVERELGRSVCVDASGDVYKFLRDCTPGDVQAAVEIRRRHGYATLAEADYLEGIWKAAEHGGVDKIGDLPRAALEAVLRR